MKYEGRTCEGPGCCGGLAAAKNLLSPCEICRRRYPQLTSVKSLRWDSCVKFISPRSFTPKCYVSPPYFAQVSSSQAHADPSCIYVDELFRTLFCATSSFNVLPVRNSNSCQPRPHKLEASQQLPESPFSTT